MTGHLKWIGTTLPECLVDWDKNLFIINDIIIFKRMQLVQVNSKNNSFFVESDHGPFDRLCVE